jgi:hypothetical protein
MTGANIKSDFPSLRFSIVNLLVPTHDLVPSYRAGGHAPMQKAHI